MSGVGNIIDKAVAAVTPLESEEDRMNARRTAEAAAQPGSWLAMVLDHHRGIETQFAEIAAAPDAASKVRAQKQLALLLTGHSVAEEAAIYPALAADHQVAHAELAYQEQAAAKMELGLLERLDPLSEDYNDKFEHIRGAVLHHIYSEEGTWFPKLVEDTSAAEQEMIVVRYREEYDRYMS
jgi:hemerythrin superfamily protein